MRGQFSLKVRRDATKSGVVLRTKGTCSVSKPCRKKETPLGRKSRWRPIEADGQKRVLRRTRSGVWWSNTKADKAAFFRKGSSYLDRKNKIVASSAQPPPPGMKRNMEQGMRDGVLKPTSCGDGDVLILVLKKKTCGIVVADETKIGEHWKKPKNERYGDSGWPKTLTLAGHWQGELARRHRRKRMDKSSGRFFWQSRQGWRIFDQPRQYLSDQPPRPNTRCASKKQNERPNKQRRAPCD